jgi:hypothetical protein
MYGSLSVVPNEDGKLATVLTRMQIHGLQRIENCCKIRGKIAQTQLVLNRLGYYFYYWRTCSLRILCHQRFKVDSFVMYTL